MATRHNQAPTAADEQFATDVDLDGLAKPWDAFINDTQLLRQENNATDDETFRANVRGFFERLLARPRIYATAYFEVKSEALARSNIERLLAELDSLPLGP
jgi:predicted metal-dependent HD superfamily phosphohydrolase